MHFINLLRQNDNEIAILTHKIQRVPKDITLIILLTVTIVLGF
jgi:hypothetical protein